MNNPSEAFTRFFASQIYDGRLTQQVMELFRNIVKIARNQFINERLNDRLKSAFSVNESKNGSDNNIVKAILRESVAVDRISMRDTKSYFGILLDDNKRKPICRLHFNYSNKYLGVFVNKNEERIEIDTVDDIFKYADRLKSTIAEYEAN